MSYYTEDLGDDWRYHMMSSVFALCTAMVGSGALLSLSVIYLVLG